MSAAYKRISVTDSRIGWFVQQAEKKRKKKSITLSTVQHDPTHLNYLLCAGCKIEVQSGSELSSLFEVNSIYSGLKFHTCQGRSPTICTTWREKNKQTNWKKRFQAETLHWWGKNTAWHKMRKIWNVAERDFSRWTWLATYSRKSA